MTSQYRHRRSSNPATPFPATIEPGEIAVNTANRQIAVGDAASGTLGTPEPLIGVRFFDTRAVYAVGDYVINAGLQYRALAVNGPGAFTPANWDAVAMTSTATGAFVSKTGDTMSGDLLISKSGPRVTLDKTDAVGANIYSTKGALNRWQLNLGSNPNDDFNLSRYNDSGVLIETNFSILRSAGTATFSQALIVNGTVTAGNAGTTGTYYFGTGTTKSLNYDGTNFNLAGGALLLPGATAAQQAQTRQTIFAAPFDAMAYNGLQINGGFDINQAAIVGVSASGNNYCVDGWMLTTGTTTAVVTGQQAATNGNQSFTGFPYVGNISISTAQVTLTGTENIGLMQRIEGYRIARLAWGYAGAQPLTIGFWSCHAPAGTYSVAVRNGPGSMSYVTTYTQVVAGAAQFNIVTIPGPTTGAWAIDNTSGLSINFVFAAGPALTSASANAWLTTNTIAAPGQVNGVASAANAFRLWGVVVLPGTEAPPATRPGALIMRPYDQELLTCRRYLHRRVFGNNEMITTLQAFGATGANGPLYPFPVQMRSAPTATTAAAAQFFCQAATGGGANPSVMTIPATIDGAFVQVTTTGLVAGNATVLYAATGAWIQLDARL